MKSTFQAGVDSIYNAIVGQGVTPAGKTPADMVTAIGTMATNKYNAGANTRGSIVKLEVRSTSSSGYKKITLSLYKNGGWTTLYYNETAEGVLVQYNT